MDLRGADRWADIVSENSSTESVYVNSDVVSTSDEVLQSDLEREDTSSDVNDINTVVVQSEIIAPQGLFKVSPHWEHEALCFTKRCCAIDVIDFFKTPQKSHLALFPACSLSTCL